jgi:hypothetical protein
MARGFESKSVSDQQEEKVRNLERENRMAEAHGSPKRRSLELARVDLLRRIETAPDAHKPRLKEALKALDDQIRQA